MLLWDDLIVPSVVCVHFTRAPLGPVPNEAPELQRARAALPAAAELEKAPLDSVLGALTKALALPAPLEDLAAFFDVLVERAPVGLVLELDGAAALFRASPEVAGALIQCWLTAVEERLPEGLAMHLVLRW